LPQAKYFIILAPWCKTNCKNISVFLVNPRSAQLLNMFSCKPQVCPTSEHAWGAKIYLTLENPVALDEYKLLFRRRKKI